ncbi:hypothetical protein [Wolbachia endosymbiont (group A) of Rhinocyllus conicus]|uniref:hypothetical protein n=1 Tax=Wolbachia endosymbiont (group A) of Rhinocyllus conicus TaxID=2954053 RepID=UPI002226F376|nr:hypothetical protein [Wolbachia endosymbiont (group A) of Rhinocyllus conicus]
MELLYFLPLSSQCLSLSSQHPLLSSQCLTLGWLCCIATEKIWWLLTKFIINNHLTVEEKICHRK